MTHELLLGDTAQPRLPIGCGLVSAALRSTVRERSGVRGTTRSCTGVAALGAGAAKGDVARRTMILGCQLHPSDRHDVPCSPDATVVRAKYACEERGAAH